MSAQPARGHHAAQTRPAAWAARSPVPGRTSAPLLAVKDLAAVLGVSADYVYRHADDLAALRLPGRAGERGRLRFDLARTLAALETSRSASERSQPSDRLAPTDDPACRRPPTAGTRVRLLPAQEVDGV